MHAKIRTQDLGDLKINHIFKIRTRSLQIHNHSFKVMNLRKLYIIKHQLLVSKLYPQHFIYLAFCEPLFCKILWCLRVVDFLDVQEPFCDFRFCLVRGRSRFVDFVDFVVSVDRTDVCVSPRGRVLLLRKEAWLP